MTVESAAARYKRLDIPMLIAGSAAFSISTLFSAMKPVLISRFVEQAGYIPGLAALAAAMPFAGGAFSSLLLPAVQRRLGARRAVMGFGVGLAIAEAINAFCFATPALLLAGQFVAGICGGMLMGLASRRIAISERSEQGFGIVDMIGVLMMSFMIALVGAAVEREGLRGGFLAASFLCTIFVAAMIVTREREPACAPHAGGDRRPAPLDIGWRAVAVIAMGVSFVTFSGLGFAFMITAARALGFGYEQATSAIGIILFLSGTGCLAGGYCAARFGPKPALLGAFALCAAGWHIAFHAQSQAVFLLALAPAIFALQFCFPILLALAGSLDDDGRLAAVAAPLIVSGFAWAAILAGFIVDRWGLAALPTGTEVGMVLCSALLLAATSRRRSGLRPGVDGTA